MQQFKGSPSPWVIEDKDTITTSDRKRAICFIPYVHHQAEANANLIAAAPELLEVAQIALKVLDSGNQIDTYMGIHNRLKAAIAKALGNEPTPR